MNHAREGNVLHSPLNENHVRLIRCISADVLLFLVRTYRLSDAPKYYALSYTWGVPYPIREHERVPRRLEELDDEESEVFWVRQKHAIYITDGEGTVQRHCIAQNLLDALLQTSRNWLNTQDWLWVDNLCINQNDIQERNHQVALMSKLYANAQAVIVWLGRDRGDLSISLRVLDEIGRMKHEPRTQTFSFKSLQARYLNNCKQGLTLEDISANRDSISASMLNLFSRTWFYRRWTWQETTVARNLVVLAGNESVSWSNLSEFADYYTTGNWAKDLDAGTLNTTCPTSAMESRMFVSKVRDSLSEYGENSKLFHGELNYETICLDVLCAGAKLKETVENDKVFACFGVIQMIAQDLGLNGFAESQWPIKVYDLLQKPDYAMSQRKLFTYITRACLWQVPALSVLSIVRHLWPTKLESSWCFHPDMYHLISKPSLECARHWHAAYPPRFPRGNRKYGGKGTLFLPGYRLGKVAFSPAPYRVPDLTQKIQTSDDIRNITELLEWIEIAKPPLQYDSIFPRTLPPRDPVAESTSRLKPQKLPDYDSVPDIALLLKLLTYDGYDGERNLEKPNADNLIYYFENYVLLPFRITVAPRLWPGQVATDMLHQYDRLWKTVREMNEHVRTDRTIEDLGMRALYTMADVFKYKYGISDYLKDKIPGVLKYTHLRSTELGQQQASLNLEERLRRMLNPEIDDLMGVEKVDLSERHQRQTVDGTEHPHRDICDFDPIAAGKFQRLAQPSKQSIIFKTDSGLVGMTDGVEYSSGTLPDGVEVWMLDGGKSPFLLQRIGTNEVGSYWDSDDGSDEEDNELYKDDGVEDNIPIYVVDGKVGHIRCDRGDPYRIRYRLLQPCYVQGVMYGEMEKYPHSWEKVCLE